MRRGFLKKGRGDQAYPYCFRNPDSSSALAVSSMEGIVGVGDGLVGAGIPLVENVFLTKQVRVADRVFPEASHAVTLIPSVEPVTGGTIRVSDPDAGRFVPAEVQDIPPSPEYSTLTFDTPVLSDADHATPTDEPGETVVYARGDDMLTEGGKISVITGVGEGVVAGITVGSGVGVMVGLGVVVWPDGILRAFRQTLVLA